jgi:electron transfer flavoprotein beta subunit
VAIHVAEQLRLALRPGGSRFRPSADGKSAEAERVAEWEPRDARLPAPRGGHGTKGLNEPRFASLKGIMAAKKKPTVERDATASGLPAPTVKVAKLAPPPSRKPPRVVEGAFPANVETLARLLREEAKVI